MGRWCVSGFGVPHPVFNRFVIFKRRKQIPDFVAEESRGILELERLELGEGAREPG